MNPEAVVSESRGRVFASLTALMQVTETDVKVRYYSLLVL